MLGKSCRSLPLQIARRSISTSHLKSSESKFNSPTTLGSQSQITKLTNGVRVISDRVPGHFSAVGVYLKAGSRFEDDSLSGVAHLLDRMAFQSTENLTWEQVQLEVERCGGNLMAHTSREVFQIQGTCYHTDLSRMVPLLSELMLRPKFDFAELEGQRQSTQFEIQDFHSNPELFLPEKLHQVAYGPSQLGRSVVCSLNRLDQVIGYDLHRFHSTLVRPENLVVAGSGMPHQELVDLAQIYFGKFQPQPANPPSQLARLASQLLPKFQFTPDFTPAQYRGGLQLVEDEGAEFNQVLVGLPSTSVTDPDIYPLAVLQALLGGGGSFSAGGPGKGMHSRLYRTVLNQYAWAHSCQAFHHSYSDSGILGIGGSCPAEFSLDLLQVIGFSLASLGERRRIGQQELQRAKLQLKHNLLMNLESPLVRVEDMGQQLVSTHLYLDPSLVTQKVDQVDCTSLSNAVQRALFQSSSSSSQPTVLVYGKNPHRLHHAIQVLSRFGIGST